MYDGLIEIKALARDPGSKAKVAVASSDLSLDVVGACVGVRGSRIQSVIKELGGEKIDIIAWDPNLATLISRAMSPAEVLRININQDERRAEVVVVTKDFSFAISLVQLWSYKHQ